MDEDALRAMMPMSFGKPQRKPAPKPAPAPAEPSAPAPAPAPAPAQASSSKAGTKRERPPSPPPDDDDDDGLTPAERAANAALPSDVDSDSDLDSDAGAGAGAEPTFGLTSSATLVGHSKTVSALAVDRSGARFATGSWDYSLALWDFGGMKDDLRPFRSWEPFGAYPVHDVSFSAQGERLLAIAGMQPAVFDRDGGALASYRKGDPYIRDMRTTNGHTGALSAGEWSPSAAGEFISASADGTVRVWDAETTQRQKSVLVLKSRRAGGGTRTHVAHARYAPGGTGTGTSVAATGTDGALHLWDTRVPSAPRASVHAAHAPDSEPTLAFAHDGAVLASRAADAVRLWDTRALRTPVASIALPAGAVERCDVLFTPDARAVLTGTQGGLLRIERASLATSTIPLGAGGGVPFRITWHARLNQLFYTTRHSPALRVLYAPAPSTRGILAALSKRARPTAHAHAHADAVPLTQAEAAAAGAGAGARKKAKTAARVPERPLTGPGRGGRIGAAATQHVVQSLWQDSTRAEDPRDALLRYADKARDDPRFMQAYRDTQPEPIYAHDDDDDDDE